MKKEVNGCDDSLPERIISRIGGKWKLLILWHLIFKGTYRFNELQRGIEGISQRMLTNQLKELEKDGLVHRKAYAEVPPRVEYSATEAAIDLKKVFKAMHNWGVHHDL